MRVFLLSLALLFCGAQISFACSMGMGVDFVEGLPEGYGLKQSIADRPKKNIKKLVQNHLQRKDWRYASSDFVVVAPDIAENGEVIPVTVKNTGEVKTVYRRVVVLIEKKIHVLDKVAYHSGIPNRNGQLPINHQIKTKVASRVIMGAFYSFPTGNPVMSLAQRFRLEDSDGANILILLEPLDTSKPVQVIYRQKPIRVHRCVSTIYVDGPMPEWLRKGYYYF